MEIPYTTKPRPDTGLYNGKIGIWLFLASEIMLFGALFSAYVLLRVGAEPGTWISGVLNVPIGTINTLVLITSSVTVVMAWASLKMHKFADFQKFQAGTVLCAFIFLGIKSVEYKDKFSHYEIWLQPQVVEKYQPYLKVNYDMAPSYSVTGHFEYEGRTPWFWTHHDLDEHGIQEIVFHPDPVGHLIETGAEEEESEAATEGEGHAEGVTIPREDIRRMSAYVPAHSTYFALYFTLTGLHALHVFGGAVVMTFLLVTGTQWWKRDPERLANRVEVSGLFWHFVDLIWIFLFPILYLL